MRNNMKSPPGWRPQPKTPLQWHQQWTTTKVIWVPSRSGRATYLELERIDVPLDVRGDPDLLMTTTSGKRFYVQFRDGSVFYPLDLPVLIYPPDAGLPKAFWVMPAIK